MSASRQDVHALTLCSAFSSWQLLSPVSISVATWPLAKEVQVLAGKMLLVEQQNLSYLTAQTYKCGTIITFFRSLIRTAALHWPNRLGEALAKFLHHESLQCAALFPVICLFINILSVRSALSLLIKIMHSAYPSLAIFRHQYLVWQFSSQFLAKEFGHVVFMSSCFPFIALQTMSRFLEAKW